MQTFEDGWRACQEAAAGVCDEARDEHFDAVFFGEPESARPRESMGNAFDRAAIAIRALIPPSTQLAHPSREDRLREAVARELHAIQCADADAERRRANMPPVETWADPWAPTGIRQLEKLRRDAERIVRAALADAPLVEGGV